MKQIEITTRLNEDITSAIDKLKKLGFTQIRESFLSDIYLSQYTSNINSNNIIETLSTSVLLRYIKTSEYELKKITYKNKEYDKNNTVLSETKVSIDCNDLNEAKKLFECLNFNELISVKSHVLVFTKDNIELAFQEVENLGTLIEFENEKDFTDKTNDEIICEKLKMLDIIKDTGLHITDEYDVKKAFELIKKKYNL